MFNSTVLKTVKASLFTAVLLAASTTAQAENSIITDVANNIEKNISSQMQEMMSKAQTELSLSIQSQMSEIMFDLGSEHELVNEQLTATNNDKPLVTSAVIKD
ncbi:hypothetical protein ACVBIO_14620 [Shewanella sp. 0m-8]